jgi:hypothetical protein
MSHKALNSQLGSWKSKQLNLTPKLIDFNFLRIFPKPKGLPYYKFF